MKKINKKQCQACLYEVNAKSTMNVMALATTKGAKIELIVNGPNEKKAMQALADLINDRFGEDG